MKEEAPQIFELQNGLTIVYQYSPGRVVTHAGLFIDAGTRDEQPEHSGIAHFIEHMLFKGTQNRRAYHILSRLDAVGGELNAYTTKEETCVYTTFTNEYFDRSMELMADIVFNSVFPEREMVKEKDVIIDEINSYKDSPGEQIYDDFEEQLFVGHALSQPILGTETTVNALQQQALISFQNQYYIPNNMVLSVVGGITSKELKRAIDKYFIAHPSGIETSRQLGYNPSQPVRQELSKTINQAHCTIGSIGYHSTSEKKIGLVLLSNLLGGPAMNSILNISIREKYGIAYNIYTSYSAYADTGIFSIYMGTDGENIEKAIELTDKQLKRLCEEPLSTQKLHQAKQQLKGQLAIAQESQSGLMQAYGKSMLSHKRLELLPEVFLKIDSLSAQDLQEISNEVLHPNQMSSLIYKPV